MFGLKDLELLEKVASRAGDIDSARGSALTILNALDDTSRFGTLGAIGALVSIHDLLTVAGLGNLCHNACSPWYECFGSRAGYLIVTQYRRHPVLLVRIAGTGHGGDRRRRTAVVAL